MKTPIQSGGEAVLDQAPSCHDGNAKKNGPAKAATFPDHGSIHPGESFDMNANSNTTAAADTARTVDLDTALHDLRNMAAIASELVTDDLASSHKRVTGSDVLYHLTPRQRDRLLFAIYHVSNMAEDLLTAFNRNEVSA